MSQPPHFDWRAHPYYHRHTAFAFHRGPRRFWPRIFWFALGAGAFAMYSKRSARQQELEGYGSGSSCNTNDRRERDGDMRGRIQDVEQRGVYAQTYVSNGAAVGSRYSQGGEGAYTQGAVVPAAEAASSSASWLPWSKKADAAENRISESVQAAAHPDNASPADKIRDVGKQAGDAMIEISESALDSLLNNIQMLKAKLAEDREQREQGRDGEKLYLEQRISSDAERNRD